ncbi:hypothetical protein JRQ81_002339 [Phrynocephalus forsythii]|uniref:Purkinje cell protein 2 homolog n=1 Tax=Phrynocephalus forsythii TaxID=171643 RepID=A0A9Q0XI60_9SAUR|nr:hypothetical protein JRQ81_002339 [Phrynocephalus forsythii]
MAPSYFTGLGFILDSFPKRGHAKSYDIPGAHSGGRSEERRDIKRNDFVLSCPTYDARICLSLSIPDLRLPLQHWLPVKQEHVCSVEAKAEEEGKKEPDPEPASDPALVPEGVPEAPPETAPEAAPAAGSNPSSGSGSPEQEGFFNLLSHVQGGRIDEQRCNIQIVHSSDKKDSPSPPPEMDNFMEMLANTQSRRMDDQRVSINYLPGFQNTDSNANNKPASGSAKK